MENLMQGGVHEQRFDDEVPETEMYLRLSNGCYKKEYRPGGELWERREVKKLA